MLADWNEQGAWFVQAGPTRQNPPDFEWVDPDEAPEPVASLMPGYTNVGQRIFESRALRAEPAIRLALYIYMQDQPAPPATLDALVDAGILESVPADAFAEDSAFVYTPDPEAPLGYTLEGGAP